MKYKKKIILKSLLLAPVPLLCLMAVLFILMNNQFKFGSIFAVIVGHLLVYLGYCLLTVPFSFLFSLVLNRYQYLNFLTICLSSLVVAAPFFTLLGWGHTGQLPKQWWLVYADIFSLFIALIPAVCYWLFLINFKSDQKQSKPCS
ncbi:hypothetical protein [Acinetobacter genomosp. 15BJ]|uniref:Uncharacterized protein n=1 Tax=Acinetobacter genomosp. 15BJ TaxID=106651 RepID=R9AZQ2_9GAMM|nr:hypothetical protein [Acinetobacter genomosp. 15BJ]EOR07663.1 hypothetical protein F896_02036 [Acinetobacter genomosp. 15BJ]MCH7292223.1 hypothetical protein [Acinetobacter genomosp. 15BJ]MDO3656152.1 hypothetical protein [Acinetobacter genomosp. 15BJ]